MSNRRKLPGVPLGGGGNGDGERPALPGAGGLTLDELNEAQARELADEYGQWTGFMPHVRPVAVTTRVRIKDAQVMGKMRPHVELTIVGPHGPFVVFMPAEMASTLAAQLDQAATGARTGLDPFAGRIVVPGV